MSGRVTSRLLVGAIRRRAEAAGGTATVLAKGDETSGAVVVALAERGRVTKLFERGLAADGSYRWVQAGPDEGTEEAAFSEYLAKRRNFDPDIWALEVDAPDAEAWLAEFIGAA